MGVYIKCDLLLEEIEKFCDPDIGGCKYSADARQFGCRDCIAHILKALIRRESFEVHDGHGDLIDKDAILFECNTARIQPGDSFVLKSDINNEPIVIPADIKKEVERS